MTMYVIELFKLPLGPGYIPDSAGLWFRKRKALTRVMVVSENPKTARKFRSFWMCLLYLKLILIHPVDKSFFWDIIWHDD